MRVAPVFKTSSTIIIDLFLISSNEISLSTTFKSFFLLIDKETKLDSNHKSILLNYQVNY